MTLDWKTGGVLLGLVFFLAFLLVKPIGVSTQFVIADGVIWDAVQPSLVVPDAEGKPSSAVTYIDQHAEKIARPWNYDFIFVLAMALGAAISTMARGGLSAAERRVPALWALNHGPDATKRFLVAFASGFIVLFGARLANGCTSGNMMSGMGQTALSGYIFTIGAFAAAIPTAIALFPRDTAE